MKSSQMFLLFAAIYAAPHMPPVFAAVLAAAAVVMAGFARKDGQ